jgi:hypothetical protein
MQSYLRGRDVASRGDFLNLQLKLAQLARFFLRITYTEYTPWDPPSGTAHLGVRGPLEQTSHREVDEPL